MDTGVAILGEILRLVGQIKEAADAAGQNKRDCEHVKSRAETLQMTLWQYQGKAEVVENEAVMSALRVVKAVFDEALAVVKDCQQRSGGLCALCCAVNLSKELSKVDARITGAETGITAAGTAYFITTTRSRWRLKTRKGAGENNSEHLRLLKEIMQAAEEIKEAVEKVQWRRAAFTAIEKRASSVMDLMTHLKNYTEREGMTAALRKLLGTFNAARDLVRSRRGFIGICVVLQPNRELVREVDEVLDGMRAGINAVYGIIMNALP